MSESGIVQLIVTMIYLVSAVWVARINMKSVKNKKDEDVKNKKERDNEKIIQQQREELEKYEKQQLNTTIKNLTENVDQLTVSVKRIEDGLIVINDQNKSQQESITKVTELNRLNGKYTQELAKLVIVMVEGFKTNHFDGNITEAVGKFHAFENSTIDYALTGNQAAVS